MIRSTLLAFALPALLGAQAIIEHSITAAAGAAAGTMMGKQVSNSLDKVLAATGAAEASTGNPKGYTKQMEGPYKGKSGAPKTRLAPEVTVKAAAIPHRAGHRPALSSGIGPFGIPFPQFPAPPVIQQKSDPAMTPPLPTYESMRSLETGAAGSDVVARLGSPSARITMPGDTGGLVEIYYYQSSGQSLGSVRLNDGAVSAVIVNNQ
ncbi:MAG: hypothetical protein JJE04_05070 [Acidobacteriia bacterium]|nr:hypothetical protein [Terriglobia bacterium]